MYAIYAGGEHTLFLRSRRRFHAALRGRLREPGGSPQAEEKLKTIKALMQRLVDKPEGQRRCPRAEQELLELNSEEWRLLGHIVASELLQPDAPMPMW
jgi:hypothetical protein